MKDICMFIYTIVRLRGADKQIESAYTARKDAELRVRYLVSSKVYPEDRYEIEKTLLEGEFDETIN